MKIIFAQGNPGAQYAFTRHNVGFFMLDEFAKKHRAEFVKKTKFHADIAELNLKGEKILLVKPTTFYNETGQSARSLVDFYKIIPATDLLVIHDDLALPFGTLRTREKGSDAGNNGIKSLNSHVGPEYNRLRLGIYSDLRDRMNDADFVLGHLSAHEKNTLPSVYTEVERIIEQFTDGTFVSTKTTV